MPDARFVLISTSHAGNVGAAARALKVMGFEDLVLVAPRKADVLGSAEALALASGAEDVLARARVVDTLGEALVDIDHVCATAMTPRDFGPPTFAPRPYLAELAARGPQTSRVAFLFGSERYGMANEDVWRSHACLSIPTAPDYGSLNLAQSVQLIAYEWRCALGSFDVPRAGTPAQAADVPTVDALLAHWERVLVALGYLDPETPRKLMPRLAGLANRVGLSRDEAQILHGVARSILALHARRDPDLDES